MFYIWVCCILVHIHILPVDYMLCPWHQHHSHIHKQEKYQHSSIRCIYHHGYYSYIHIFHQDKY